MRISDAQWQAAKAKAEREGRTITEILRECLDEYTADDERDRGP